MNSNELITIFSETAESIRQKSGKSDLLTPATFATEVAKLGEVPFSNIAFGTEEPDATKYKYWIPVPTTKDKTPLAFEKWCYNKEIITKIFGRGDTTLEVNSSNDAHGYNGALRTKDYMTQLDKNNAFSYNITFTFYRINRTFGTMSFGATYDRNDYKRLTRGTIFPTGPSSGKNCYTVTNSLYLDNIVYFIYKTTTSNYTIVKYDLDTDTSEVLGSFTETAAEAIWFYVHDNGGIYYKTQNSSNNNWVYNIYKLKSSDGSTSKISVGSFSSPKTHSSSPVRLNNDLVLLSTMETIFNSDSATGYILDTSVDKIITKTATVNLTNEALSGKTSFNIDSYLSFSRYASTLISLADDRNSTLTTMVSLKKGSVLYGLAIMGYRAEKETKEIFAEPLLILEPDPSLDYISCNDEVIGYDEESKTVYFLFKENSMPVYQAGYDHPVTLDCDAAPCIISANYSGTSRNLPAPEYRYESPCDTENRVVLATLNCSDDERRGSRFLYKFYQTSELFTYVAADDNSNPPTVPVFYKGKTYTLMFSNGSNWVESLEEDLTENMTM